MAKTNTAAKPKSSGKTKPLKPQAKKQAPVDVQENQATAETDGIITDISWPDTNASDVMEATQNAITTSEALATQTESIVQISHNELQPFKGHPFKLRDDDDMKALVASVKERGIDQPVLVRPRDGGGYELIAGHRRQHAAELAGHTSVPCVVRKMTDDEAVLAMTESNLNHRSEILPSERAKALKMQLEAIKHQGSRGTKDNYGEVSKRSNEIVAERNRMSVKNTQRYIALNNLVPDLMQYVDEKKMKFITAVELSYIKPRNQQYIAVAIDAQQSTPSGSQAQRMRELDQQGVLNADVIDGIMCQEKKEEIRVILNSQELGKYFGAEKSPREMKEQILKLLDDWKSRQLPELDQPTKLQQPEK